MIIVGHGVDLVEIADLKQWIDDPRDPLVPRCFTARELAEVGGKANRVERLAGRFAAKEAVMKTLGTGFGNGVAFTDIEICRPSGGSPKVYLSGGAAHIASQRGISSWQLSISHSATMAMASAIAIGIQPSDAIGCG